MKATKFEVRHQALLHLLLVAVAFLVYFIQRDDIVWAWIKDSPQNRLFERLLFAVATVLIGVGAVICSWERMHPEFSLVGAPAAGGANGMYRYLSYPRYFGGLLYSVGLGSLAPPLGFVILVVGEALFGLRLIRGTSVLNLAKVSALPQGAQDWGQGIRREAGKWGLFVTMIVFTIVLVDRVAEVLALASLLVWLALNRSQLRGFPLAE